MTKPTLASGPAGARQLAADLRRPMPENFIFEFSDILSSYKDDPKSFVETYGRDCGYAGCAMGFAQIFYSNVEYGACLAYHFDMNEEDESNILYGKGYPSSNEEITPEMVADALDAWADRQESADG
jgi:hypothetical protein